MIIKILIAALVFSFALFVYACARAASLADREMEKMSDRAEREREYDGSI